VILQGKIVPGMPQCLFVDVSADVRGDEAFQAPRQDGDEGDEVVLGPVEDRVQSAVVAEPSEEPLRLPVMVPLIRLGGRESIRRRIGQEGSPGQRKIDVIHPDQPDPAAGDVGQPSL
jgi:hypothetical protein